MNALFRKAFALHYLVCKTRNVGDISEMDGTLEVQYVDIL